MARSFCLILVAVCVVAATRSPAQHDPQRNATIAIAHGEFKNVDKILGKAEPDDPETRFVRMMAALAQDDMPAAVAEAEAAMKAGLSFERLQAGPWDLLAGLRETPEFAKWAAKHGGTTLLHGPMLGAVTDSGASVWVRTVGPAEVRVRVGTRLSEPVKTGAATHFAAVVPIEGLKPATSYPYEVLVDGRVVPVEGATLRTSPVAGKPAAFAVAFGGGAGFVPKWEYMWDTIRARKPAAMLMLGDNVYIDDPEPESLLTHHYCYSRRQQRAEWRRLTAGTAMYEVYDDHDFGKNDCVPGPDIESPAWKRQVWNVFRENWVNPAYGGGGKQPGCWFDFQIADVHFILLDGRYYRDREGGSMLGPVQKAWLKETLTNSTATFKVLASPVPWTAKIKPGSKDPWDGFPEEREEIFSFIEDQEIEGLFLVAADRHRTDLRTTARPDGYTLYEFESSKLTNRHTHGVVKTPGLIWGHNKVCSFGLMRFDTTKEDPQVVFECVDIDGKVEHSFTLKRSMLER